MLELLVREEYLYILILHALIDPLGSQFNMSQGPDDIFPKDTVQ